MASAKQKRELLEKWGAHFPLMRKWKNQFLLRRCGLLLSGICLDGARDPGAYKPTFFFHNLLVKDGYVTLSYAVPLMPRGVPVQLKFDNFSDRAVNDFKNQTPILCESITFSKFFHHVVDCYHGKLGVHGVYLPHALKDIITASAYGGDIDYAMDSIDECAKLIEIEPGINMAIIGSVEKWAESARAIVNCDLTFEIERELTALGLLDLQDQGMPYERIERFWEAF